MPIPDDKRRQIKEVIGGRTHAALVHSGLIGREYRLHPTSDQGIVEEVKTFANHVVLIEHAGEWDKEPFYPRELAERMPLFLHLPLKDLGGHDSLPSNFPSWLYFGKRRGEYGAVMAVQTIEARFIRRIEAQQYKFYLFLHELNHLILHRDFLWAHKGQTQWGWTPGGVAETWMEEEADFGVFCMLRRFGFTVPPSFYFADPGVS